MTESAAGRWWENYLVRYFMPSIAGIGIVSWLIFTAPSIREILFFGDRPDTIDAPTLTLLILYGNLFCYIASYPILCFHTTRVLDGSPEYRIPWFLCGYKSSFLFSVLALGCSRFFSFFHPLIVPIVIVSAFSLVQAFRIYRSIKPCSEQRERMFSYLDRLSKKRCVSVPIIQVVGKFEKIDASGDSEYDPPSGGNVRLTNLDVQHLTKEFLWRKEFTDSYRHMREHGNSAYIFLLEIALAGICYETLSGSPNDGWKQLSNLSFVLALWSAPAIGVHWLAQSLEREFAKEPKNRLSNDPSGNQAGNAHKTIEATSGVTLGEGPHS